MDASLRARCFECGAKATHYHHVVPLSRGGTRTVPLCASCHGLVHGRSMVDSSSLVRAALAVKRARGERVGMVPIGYQLAADGRHLVELPAEQRALELIRELRAAGLSLRAIVARLNETTPPLRGSRWHLPTVHRLAARVA